MLTMVSGLWFRLSIHAPMAPPHFQGSVGAQRTSWMLPKKPSKLGFLQKAPPAVRHPSYHPNYFLLGFRATPSIPTSTNNMICPPQAGPPGRGLEGLKGFLEVFSLEARASGFQGFRHFQPSSTNLHYLQVGPWASRPSEGRERNGFLRGCPGCGRRPIKYLPMYEELGGARNVHSPETPPIVLPSTGVKADVCLQCLTRERPKQAEWEFRVCGVLGGLQIAKSQSHMGQEVNFKF